MVESFIVSYIGWYRYINLFNHFLKVFLIAFFLFFIFFLLYKEIRNFNGFFLFFFPKVKIIKQKKKVIFMTSYWKWNMYYNLKYIGFIVALKQYIRRFLFSFILRPMLIFNMLYIKKNKIYDIGKKSSIKVEIYCHIILTTSQNNIKT